MKITLPPRKKETGEKSVFGVECSLNTGGSLNWLVKLSLACTPKKRVHCLLDELNRKVQAGLF